MKENHEPEFDFDTEYEELRKKYDLPEFEVLAEDFEIEKITEEETLFLARKIRRNVAEKMIAYLHLFENLINPSSPPLFMFKILKHISESDKKIIQETYKILSKIQLETMKMDTSYSEEAEGKFIKETFEIWQEIKPKVIKLIENFQTNFEGESISKERTYFD